MSALASSFDPDEPETPRRRDDRTTIEAGAIAIYGVIIGEPDPRRAREKCDTRANARNKDARRREAAACLAAAGGR